MIISPQQFNAEMLVTLPLVKRRRGSRKKFKERQIVNIVGAFDIETTTLTFTPVEGQKYNSHSFMYVWQWAVGADTVIVGRTWEQFLDVCRRIQEVCEQIKKDKNLTEKPVFISFVHNLAYEFQFLSGIYNFQSDECFFRDERKPIYCRMFNCIEFRCSYIQSNMSLDMFCKKMGCQTLKKSGQQFDYHKQRFPWTELTAKELQYCTSDVIGLQQAITNEMLKDDDTLRTIPLTSTGYVRRDCKQAVASIRKWQITPILPKMKEYRILRKAFRGGNTHANRYYAGQILENVQSVDMSSCYPAQQLTKPFPVSKFQDMYTPYNMRRVSQYIHAGYAVVATYRFKGLILKDKKEPIPYLALAKTRSRDFVLDNGRILEAAYCETTLTEIDLKIVLKQYKFDRVQVTEAIVAKMGQLPECYKDVIRKYYDAKTKLKGAKDADAEYTYMKSKNKLNGIYGMSAQDPVHQQISYDNGQYHIRNTQDEDADFALQKAHFPYFWGVYCTSWARYSLQQAIDIATEQGIPVVYCDTDSVKTLGHADFDKLNKARQKAATEYKAYADENNGTRHYMGVFEVDAYYDKFIAQHAKCYAYEKKGHMSITVSGVTHKVDESTGEQFCVEELKAAGGLEAFKPGMTFYKAGGTAAVYNDEDDFDYADLQTGKVVHITRNVSIVDSTYRISYTDDYEQLLKDCLLYGEWKKIHE